MCWNQTGRSQGNNVQYLEQDYIMNRNYNTVWYIIIYYDMCLRSYMQNSGYKTLNKKEKWIGSLECTTLDLTWRCRGRG